MKIFGNYQKIETKTYSQCLKEHFFKEQYWTSNPGTMFVKEIDLNTNKEIINDNQLKFASQVELINAKQQLNSIIEQEKLP